MPMNPELWMDVFNRHKGRRHFAGHDQQPLPQLLPSSRRATSIHASSWPSFAVTNGHENSESQSLEPRDSNTAHRNTASHEISSDVQVETNELTFSDALDQRGILATGERNMATYVSSSDSPSNSDRTTSATPLSVVHATQVARQAPRTLPANGNHIKQRSMEIRPAVAFNFDLSHSDQPSFTRQSPVELAVEAAIDSYRKTTTARYAMKWKPSSPITHQARPPNFFALTRNPPSPPLSRSNVWDDQPRDEFTSDQERIRCLNDRVHAHRTRLRRVMQQQADQRLICVSRVRYEGNESRRLHGQRHDASSPFGYAHDELDSSSTYDRPGRMDQSIGSHSVSRQRRRHEHVGEKLFPKELRCVLFPSSNESDDADCLTVEKNDRAGSISGSGTQSRENESFESPLPLKEFIRQCRTYYAGSTKSHMDDFIYLSPSLAASDSAHDNAEDEESNADVSLGTITSDDEDGMWKSRAVEKTNSNNANIIVLADDVHSTGIDEEADATINRTMNSRRRVGSPHVNNHQHVDRHDSSLSSGVESVHAAAEFEEGEFELEVLSVQNVLADVIMGRPCYCVIRIGDVLHKTLPTTCTLMTHMHIQHMYDILRDNNANNDINGNAGGGTDKRFEIKCSTDTYTAGADTSERIGTKYRCRAGELVSLEVRVWSASAEEDDVLANVEFVPSTTIVPYHTTSIQNTSASDTNTRVHSWIPLVQQQNPLQALRDSHDVSLSQSVRSNDSGASTTTSLQSHDEGLRIDEQSNSQEQQEHVLIAHIVCSIVY